MPAQPRSAAGDAPVQTDVGPSVERRRSSDNSALRLYLRDLRRSPLLTPEDEHDIALLFAKTRASDLAARLINANLRVVWKIALEYRREHRNLLDLVQEGNLGLIQAVNKYDPHRGVKLSSYAAWWIRAYILKFIPSNARLVKLGTTPAQRRLFFGLSKERAKMESRCNEVETKQLAAALHVSEKELTEMEGRLGASEASLDSPLRQQGDDSGTDRTYMDLVCADARLRPDHQSEDEEFRGLLRLRLDEFADTLAGRDVEIFHGRLVSEDAATLGEIAARLGVSNERVRQLEEKIKARLRRHLEASLGDAVHMTSLLN
jgi:RNA polymerase sigma-32 factor